MKKIWYILDGNEYEDRDFFTKEELEEEDITICENWREVKSEARDLIKDYYECSSEYGDVVADLFKYIPDTKIKDLLEEFNYILKEMEVEE